MKILSLKPILQNLRNRISVSVTAIFLSSLFINTYASDLLDQEYERHQKVSNRFFSRLTNKPDLRDVIDSFKQGINDYPLIRISLDGLSSRTRILLWRELTAFVKEPNLSIPFILNNKEFNINLIPTLRQPGNGLITGIGTYNDIYTILRNLTPDYQKAIADKLIKARNKKPYHSSIPNPIIQLEGKTLDLEFLNILLDFEVARRLQKADEDKREAERALEIAEDVCGIAELDFYRNSNSYYYDKRTDFQGDEQEEKKQFMQPYQEKLDKVSQISTLTKEFSKKIDLNISQEKDKLQSKTSKKDIHKKIPFIEKERATYDEVPIATAIIRSLTLNILNQIHFAEFFNAPDTYRNEFKYGTYNAFQGVANPNHRQLAIKNILQLSFNQKVSTLEKIHQEYLKIFGGEDESDGEEYDGLDF